MNGTKEEMDKLFEQPPALIDILWRELKIYKAEYCKTFGVDPDKYWGKYNIKLIKESQGKV